MKKILILEDQKEVRDYLENIINGVFGEKEVYSTDNVDSAYRFAIQETIDVFLIDIILNVKVPKDVSGIIYADRIRRIEKYMFTPIIFITSLQDLELYSYRNLQCYGYIEKPFNEEEVRKIISKAMLFKTDRGEDKVIYFRKEGVLFAYKVADIIYTEVYRHTMKIFGINTQLEIPYMTCKDFLKEADVDFMIQCSRNTIINKKFIENVDFTNRIIKLKKIEMLIMIGITYVKKLEKELKL